MIDAGRRRGQHRAQLSPHSWPVVSTVQQQTGNAEQRLAEKRAGDAAGNLVIARRRRGFAGDLPERTRRERVERRRPVAETVRPGDPVIHRPLVGMAELVDLERVFVDDPRTTQVTAKRARRHFILGRLEEPPTGEVQREVHRHDFDRRQQVAPVAQVTLRLRGFVLRHSGPSAPAGGASDAQGARQNAGQHGSDEATRFAQHPET